jgi:hypothetical protein
MALLRIPFGSACRNDALEKRYFPNSDGVLVKRGFAATGVADDDGAHENRCGEPSGRQSAGGSSFLTRHGAQCVPERIVANGRCRHIRRGLCARYARAPVAIPRESLPRSPDAPTA